MERKFDINKDALQLAHEAEVKHVTLSSAMLVAYVMKFIQLVRAEILMIGKRTIAATDNELYDKVIEAVNVTKDEYADSSTEVFLIAQYKTIHEALWQYVSTEEATNIANRLKSDSSFARHFFYDTAKGCNISSLRNNIRYKIAQTYHLNLSNDYIGSIIYRKLWSYGTWSTLDTFSRKSTFFSWLSKVAFNAVIEELEDQHLIHINRCKTSSNTRLKLKSKDPEFCQFVIEHMLPECEAREILLAVYAKRLDDVGVMQSLNIKSDVYAKKLADAETSLKDALIESDLWIADEVVRDKDTQITMVSSEFATDFKDWLSNQDEDDIFKDIFDINLTAEERSEAVIKVINAISDTIKWSDEERYVWEQRYLYNESPEKLANELNHLRTWVDNRYSRARKKFNEAAKQWWNDNVDYQKL